MISFVIDKFSSSVYEVASSLVDKINVFTGVDFSVLYSWLPSDISGTCALLITFCFIMFALGIIDKFIVL